MTDTERIELQVEQKLRPLIADKAQRQQVAREINALAKILISAYRTQAHDKRQPTTTRAEARHRLYPSLHQGAG